MPKGIKETIDFDRIYNSQYDGPYRIIEDLGFNDKGYHKVNIQFLETNNIQEAILYRAQRGQVRDRNKRIPDFNAVYQSNNFGPFKFLELLGSCGTKNSIAKIQFIETGTICDVKLSDALNGNIRDNFRPNVCGFGFIGNASSKCREYSLWLDMIARCYNPNDVGYAQYGAKGVTVCERWRNFENFLNDIKYLPGYDLWLNNPGCYQIDKDMLQMDVPECNKVYSPETCCFIDQATNMKYAALYQSRYNESKTSNYIGVFKDKGKPSYRAAITVNQHKHNLGSYRTEEAAANVYNNISRLYYNDPKVLNNVSVMDPKEILANQTRVREMCKIINK